MTPMRTTRTTPALLTLPALSALFSPLNLLPLLGLLNLLALLAAGCATADRPRIALKTPCASCSMEITDLRFACARRAGATWRPYDSIECLIQEAAKTAGGPAWLADYDTRTFHPADSLWVVKGAFPSPMGGGFAAFANREAADRVASETHGSADRFAAWAAKGWP